MKTLVLSSSVLISVLAISGPAVGQVPGANGTSDTSSNTGVGHNALGGPKALATGSFDTAVGSGALVFEDGGSQNTAIGVYTLGKNTTGIQNTALGASSLDFNATGSNNTATGFSALFFNDYYGTAPSGNTADGAYALYNGTNGGNNTAVGFQALYGGPQLDIPGAENTGIGAAALYSYSTGSYNTAAGMNALYSNTSGSYNTASGFAALSDNTTADYNTASGYQALYKSNGVSNTASGFQALYADTSGEQNTAAGVHALANNSSGSNNIAEGYHGGYNLTTGSNNIDIGSPGVAAESDVIRIGTITGTTPIQKAAYVAGIYGVKTATSGMAVVIDSSGQLGTVSSSRRYKEDIQPIAGASERLLKLRPVSFRYKQADASGEKPIQYGLIAEEVAEVYPELVVRDATTSRIDGVRYDELAPMLLNEMQQEQKAAAARAAAQEAHARAQDAKIEKLERQLLAMQAAVARAQGSGELVTGR
jgi:hypothetical protein